MKHLVATECYINLRGLLAAFPATPQTELISADEGLNPETRVQRYTALAALTKKAFLSQRAHKLWFEAPAQQWVAHKSERNLAAFRATPQAKLFSADEGLTPDTRVQGFTALAAPTKEASLSLRADELWFQAPARQCAVNKSERTFGSISSMLSADEGLNPETGALRFTAVAAPTKKTPFSLRADKLCFEAPALQRLHLAYELTSSGLKHLRSSEWYINMRGLLAAFSATLQNKLFSADEGLNPERRVQIFNTLALPTKKAPLSQRADELTSFGMKYQLTREWYINMRGLLAPFPATPQMELISADEGLNPETRVHRYTALAAPTKEASLSLRADELWFQAPARQCAVNKSERTFGSISSMLSADEGLNPETGALRFTAVAAPTKEASLSLRADELWFQAPARQCAVNKSERTFGSISSMLSADEGLNPETGALKFTEVAAPTKKAPLSLQADELGFEADVRQ
ncbi:hypothetical protein NDU88_003775 [Pleurodeles waltl]|uniref:Uncharacterized protein n=1 Tax=Pleurodeles waltl TaxID=8319 RepID=A0AAV7TQP0_PLEWA|nr:hypothetical protein NDU88_003775 [Pleurodeles waltl]